MRRTWLAVLVLALGLPATAQAVNTPIHDIQGNGTASPHVGESVTTTGIVTARKANGFFIQESLGDADPNTSEGILVFTSSAPTAALGDSVNVTGTVTEFAPRLDPFSPTLTEITSPTVSVQSSGNMLPSAVAVTAADMSPSGGISQLERFEGMRVSVSSLTVTEPTRAVRTDSTATETSTGLIHGVITGGSRPYREPGIEEPDPAPAGTIPPIPRWDANPEVLGVDSDGQVGGSTIDVDTGAAITGLTGVLDYSQRAYTVLPDTFGSPPSVTGEATATAVPAADAGEVTVGSFNLNALYDAVDDPGPDPVLSASDLDRRLGKMSLAIRNLMGSPDVLAVQEAENLAVLSQLSSRISSDAGVAAQPDPAYQPYLIEGNEPAGLDVGVLVKSSVHIDGVAQQGQSAQLTRPDSSTEALWERPPLLVEATRSKPGYGRLSLAIVVTDNRSLTGIGSPAAEANGYDSLGQHVRAKRKAQADFLANLVQARQSAGAKVIALGSFNAFQFSDGYVDVLGTIEGAPVPDNETVVSGDGADLVNPDLVNLVDGLPAAERYSITRGFRGSAAALDHVLVSESLDPLVTDFAFARANADFRTTLFNDGTRAERSADRDLPVAYLELPPPAPGTFRFSSAAYSTPEAGAATITVERTGGSDGAASVSYATGGGGTATPGADYTAASGTLDFADGETTKTFSVPITADTVDEPDETVELVLTGAVSAPSTAVLTIVDDDLPGSSLIDVTAPVTAFTRSSLAMSRTGRVAVPIRCTEDDPAGCSGRVRLVRLRKGTLGSAAFSILPGHTKRVPVRLSRKNRRLVTRLRRVRVVGTAVAHDSHGNTGTSRRTMTLRAPKRRG
jgi:predicted extracellular nuclease